MRNKILLFLTAAIVLVGCKSTSDDNNFELWYNQPATIWEEALPIGNGNIGAMIFGNPQCEHLQFNEETLWDSGPRDYNKKEAWRNLDKIRTLLFEGKQREAERFSMETFMGRVSYEETFERDRKLWADSIVNLNFVKEAIQMEFDDSQWPTMSINYKSVWEENGLPDLNGSVLFRRNITIPATWTDKEVTFQMGHIKDEDYTYINGKLIGYTYNPNGNRVYRIPANTFKTGENTIAVLINNYVSTGGFNGVRRDPQKMNLQAEVKNSEIVIVDGDWKYKVIDDYPPYYPQFQANYQPFGDLKIEFEGHDNYSNYRRNINLNDALANVSYKVGNVTYYREMLASNPDNLIAIKLWADKKGSINFATSFSSPHKNYITRKSGENSIAIDVKVDNGEMRGTAVIVVENSGGDILVNDDNIKIINADEATIKLIAATNYVSYKEISANEKEIAENRIKEINKLSYSQIKETHLEDYKKYFDRFTINLGDKSKRNIPTDQRIINYEKEVDNDLAALYVQYARYLMLSSGREGTKPANLQGIWNDKLFPPWGSKYTSNINIEMNYWPVEPLNIAECHYSLFDMIDEIAINGAITAKEYYNANGWLSHHNTDQWRGTAPINNSNHGIWVTGGAWLSIHLWEHFLYSRDIVFLKNRAYPLMKGAAEFFVDFLIEDPKTGYLISTPSNSPETGGLVAGPTMDHQIIRELYKNVIEASEILNIDSDFANILKEQYSRIAPNQIGKHGQLQEWMEDKDDPNNKHRHVSHLWGMHPGKDINWIDSPDIMDAARQSLIFRGDDGTGWSLAWKINFWARFLDGEHAHDLFKLLFSNALDPERTGGGSYPNLFDSHPPFQIDGNFGGAAGVIEMIMQSHMGVIDLLPAIPQAWKDGSISGLRARGGFEIDMDWKNSKPQYVKVLSNAGELLKIKHNDTIIEIETKKGEEYIFNNW